MGTSEHLIASPHVHVPDVGIDGRSHRVFWGTCAFDIPADRACHVSVSYNNAQAAAAPPPTARRGST